MKDYIKYVTSVIIWTGSVFLTLLVCNMNFRKNCSKEIIQAKPDVSTAVFGSSTGECAINDEMLEHYKNFCYSGLRLAIGADFYKAVIDANPQFQTIILCFDRFQFYSHSDKVILGEKASYYRAFSNHIAYFQLETIRSLSTEMLVKCYIGANVMLFSPRKVSFGYRKIIGSKLRQPGFLWNDVYFDKMYKIKKDIPYNATIKTHRLNQNALKSLIAHCHRMNKTVVILSTPMYHLDNWFGRKGYEDFLGTLDERVLIADYSDFPMPSDDYYGDVIHLNYKGAEYFSKHLKEYGLQAIPVKEYLKLKKTDSN